MKLVGYSSTIDLGKGDAVVIIPGAWHYESYSQPRQSYRACWLFADSLLTCYIFTHYAGRSFEIPASGALPRLNEAALLEAVAREIDERPVHWRAKAQSLLLKLLVDFDRRKQGGDFDTDPQELDPVQKLLHIVNARFREPLQIQLLAKEVGMSPDHLGRRFHSSCGVTFKDHLNAIRIHHAQHLLRSGKPIKEVAQECGFSDIHYFGRVFKKRCKISPGRFLREL